MNEPIAPIMKPTATPPARPMYNSEPARVSFVIETVRFRSSFVQFVKLWLSAACVAKEQKVDDGEGKEGDETVVELGAGTKE